MRERRSPSTAATTAIRRPRRSPCRSTRPPPMRSTAPTMAPRSSISKWRATATPGSAIRPPRCWSSASPRWKAASRRSCVACGQAAVNYAVLNIAEMGTNIVSVPQLYGTTHTLFAHMLPRQGITVRFAEDDQPASIERLIDDETRAVFCESVGNPAGNVCDIEALAEVAHRHGVPLIVDNTVADADPAEADRIRRRYRRAFADEVHGRARHHARRHHRRQRQVPVDGASPALSDVQRAGAIVPRPGLSPSTSGRAAYIARCRSRLPADHRRRAVAAQRVPAAPGHRDRRAAGRAPRRERREGRASSCATTAASDGSTTRASRTAPITRWRRSIWAAGRVRC